MAERALPTERGFDPDLAGKKAECDGGASVPGTYFAGRQDFTGKLTGDYIDHGDPPWRWLLMVELTRKPENYQDESVWCESESVFLTEEEPG